MPEWIKLSPLFAAAILVPLLVVAGCLMMDAHSAPQPVCVDAETRELARKLVLDGFDNALKDHSRKIFDVWLRDGQDDPSRAASGMRNGIDAYERARTAILQWQPPACKGDKR